jgi:hypothetical protein
MVLIGFWAEFSSEPAHGFMARTASTDTSITATIHVTDTEVLSQAVELNRSSSSMQTKPEMGAAM